MVCLCWGVKIDFLFNYYANRNKELYVMFMIYGPYVQYMVGYRSLAMCMVYCGDHTTDVLNGPFLEYDLVSCDSGRYVNIEHHIRKKRFTALCAVYHVLPSYYSKRVFRAIAARHKHLTRMLDTIRVCNER